MPIRSQHLIAFQSSAGQLNATFQCPAGFITLVKTAYFNNNQSSAISSQLLIFLPGEPFAMYIFNQSVPASSETSWQGWVALNPGDYVQVSASAAGMNFWVSGAILPGPPQFPSA